MSLRHIKPESSLQPNIRTITILDEPQAVFNKRIVLPDSYPALLINFGAPFVGELENGTQIELPHAFFAWMQSKPLKIKATGYCHAIIVSMFPWGTRFMLDEYVDLATLPIIPLTGVWRDLLPTLEATLYHHGDMEAVATLAQFVCDLCRPIHIDTFPIRTAVQALYTTNGHFNMNTLAAESCLSLSQLERHFKYFTGQSPKTMARLIRFDAVCSGLLTSPTLPLTDLAHRFGYVDQSHFIHEFKTFATCTPGEARAYLRKINADAEIIQFS